MIPCHAELVEADKVPDSIHLSAFDGAQADILI